MNERRYSLWNNSRKAEYTANHDTQVSQLIAESKGEHTAKKIEEVLATLSLEESDFVELLLLSQKNTVVARYDAADPLFPELVEKGLLQLPTGVGTVSLLKLTTTFRVPIAVWQALNERAETPNLSVRSAYPDRLQELENQFKERFDVLVESAEIAPTCK